MTQLTGEEPSARSARVRLLYLMHVDWDWIPQRPQFIAGELAQNDDFDLLVAYLHNWRRRHLVRTLSEVTRVRLPQLPFSRFAAIRVANGGLAKAALIAITRAWRPTAVWLTHPMLYGNLPATLRASPLFYDCMDLATGFVEDSEERRALEGIERRLVRAAAATFVPSHLIGDVVSERYRPSGPVVLVRNGYDGRLAPVEEPASLFADPERILRLGYFGTISSWFDWPTVLGTLAYDPRLEVHLWGPTDGPVPSHERILFHGPVAHEAIPQVVGPMDALVMPFLLSDLIRGVDPVKLYEYVALGKPAFAVAYPEVERFGSLVHLYRSSGQLNELLARLRQERASLRPSAEAARSFLSESTWAMRAATMAGILRERIRHD